jgi:spore maturation protein CgeB
MMKNSTPLKIIYFFREIETFMWQWQRKYIFEELYYHNCYIEVLNPLHFPSYEEANESLLSKLQNKDHYDLVMTPHNEEVLFIATLQEIKKAGIPTLLFCPDSLLIPFHYKNICSHFDLVWITSNETANLYKRWGANTIMLPFAANPNYFNPDFENEINKVCFIGSPHSNRSKILNKLLEGNIPTSVYAKINKDKPKGQSIENKNKRELSNALTMMRFGVGRKLLVSSVLNKLIKSAALNIESENLEIIPPVSFEELPTVYSRYALSLATSAAKRTGDLPKPVDFILLRNFEIPMSGGLQLCSYSNELSQYFEEDKEILFYRNNKEFIDKANFYLRKDNHSLRINMKLAARKRAENEHTWFNRFEKIFAILEIEWR